MRVLVVGGGAREHALAWKLKQSPDCSGLFVSPGNAGTATIAHNLQVSATDIRGLALAARQHGIDVTVVGPEAPLAAGIVDLFQEHGLAVFGPSRAAARVESSKAFARGLMERQGVPRPAGVVFDSYRAAKAFVEVRPAPLVVKADGLAEGKGVVVAASREEALQALNQIMIEKVRGPAGDRVVVEECLSGKEVSLLALTDGEAVVPLAAACDHKRVFDRDKGPNTGGMGAYSPPRSFDQATARQVQQTILEPVVRGLAQAGTPYKGVLYAGLMMTDSGPKVLEFNARFGDPETQVILPRLKTDLLKLMLATIRGKLASTPVEWSDDACVGVVMASGGYPGSYRKGFGIEGLDSLDGDVTVFHAGTMEVDGRLVTDGGRVLTVTATGPTLAAAREKVYANLPRVTFQGCHYRKDIALAEAC